MLIEIGNDICIQNIIVLRNKYTVSRRALAKLIDIPEFDLRCMEQGKIPTVFTHEQLVRISQVFNIPIEEFINKHIL